MITQTQTDKVAYALFAKHRLIKYGKQSTQRDWDWLDKTHQENYKRKAKAAIIAYNNTLKNTTKTADK